MLIHHFLHYSIQNFMYIMFKIFMHCSQDYSQDHCQNNPPTLEMMFYYNT